jgi:transposase InsO family protein
LGLLLSIQAGDSTNRQRLHNEVQRQYGQDILMIQSDNGTEFKNYTLNDFLSDEGIRHQYSSPYTPQQNGVAERKNRTLIDMDRTMLAEFKSPYNFWAEAIIPRVMHQTGYISARA